MESMSIDVRLSDNSELSAHVGIPDFVAFERKYDVPASKIGRDNMRFEWLLFLAHNALRRQGETKAKFDDFIEDVAEVDAGGADPSDEGEDS